MTEKCVWCGKKVKRPKTSKYCSVKCLYQANLTRRFKIKMEKHSRDQIKEIKVITNRGERSIKF